MTHPTDEILATYVDGSLPASDRAAVDAHLAMCARCTRDVTHAGAARSTLRALPDVAVPEDLAIPTAAEAEAAAADAHRLTVAPAWQRWAGPAAAVAAAALVVTLVLPRLGGSSADSTSDAAAGRPAASGAVEADASQVPLELQDTDYDPDSLSQLAGQTAARVAPDQGAVSAPETSATAVPKVGTGAAAAKANGCIQEAFREVPGALVRLIRATFQGAPAYIGFYAEGPGAGVSPDTLTARVAAVDGCAPLSFAGVPL